MARVDFGSVLAFAAVAAQLSGCSSCSALDALLEGRSASGAAPPLAAAEEAAANELAAAALRALPLAWDRAVVSGEYHPHDPDSLETALELFPEADRPRLARLAGASGRSLPASSLPWTRVASGAAFDELAGRPGHLAVFVSVPLLAADGRAGLVVAQVQGAGPGGLLAVDHWALMEREAAGPWARRPVPAALRAALHLDDATAGGPPPPAGGVAR